MELSCEGRRFGSHLVGSFRKEESKGKAHSRLALLSAFHATARGDQEKNLERGLLHPHGTGSESRYRPDHAYSFERET